MSGRNNEERIGAVPSITPPPLEANEPFSFSTPTEFVELPSKGRFYSDDHPLKNSETIEIRYMTAKDEDILSSRALLQKGIAIERMLQNIVVDKSVKVDDLLIGDKNALIVAARRTGYGDDYSTNIVCPMCASTVNYSFDLSKCKITLGSAPEDTKIEQATDGAFSLVLPKSDVTVEVKLMTSDDEKKLGQLAESKRKHGMPESILTDQFKTIIKSVNGQEDRATVASFVESMPASDSRYIRNVYAEVAPNLSLNQWFACTVCAHEEEVNVPFTADFFWPK